MLLSRERLSTVGAVYRWLFGEAAVIGAVVLGRGHRLPTLAWHVGGCCWVRVASVGVLFYHGIVYTGSDEEYADEGQITKRKSKDKGKQD